MTTTRDGPSRSNYGFNVGTRCGDVPAAVAKNRAFLRDVLWLPSEPCWLRQVHGTRVVTLDAPLQQTAEPRVDQRSGRARRSSDRAAVAAGEDPGGRRVQSSRRPFAVEEPDPEMPRAAAAQTADADNHPQEPQADAAVSRTPGVVLAIQAADCLPVLLGADDGSEIAAAHAGWRGLSAGVLEATLDAMHTPHPNLVAWLGPAIAAKSYEVGDEVRDAFLAHDRAATSAFSATRAGHWSCDLYELARQRLRAAGVSCIAGGGFDTFTDPRLHSYRRDGAHSGRMVSLIWIAQ